MAAACAASGRRRSRSRDTAKAVTTSGKTAVNRPIEKPERKEKVKPPTVAMVKMTRARRYARSRKRMPSKVPTRKRARDPQAMTPKTKASVGAVWSMALRYWKIAGVLELGQVSALSKWREV